MCGMTTEKFIKVLRLDENKHKRRVRHIQGAGARLSACLFLLMPPPRAVCVPVSLVFACPPLSMFACLSLPVFGSGEWLSGCREANRGSIAASTQPTDCTKKGGDNALEKKKKAAQMMWKFKVSGAKYEFFSKFTNIQIQTLNHFKSIWIKKQQKKANNFFGLFTPKRKCGMSQ